MSKHKLLLADDSITIQKVVNLTFADEGIEVISVGDGDSAMAKFEEVTPDLVMADINMPGLSGYEICERIKGNEATRRIPVILLVGSFEPFDEREAERVGANDYLTKPFQSIRQLVSKVSDLLNSPTGAEEVAEEAETPGINFDDTLRMDEQIDSSESTDDLNDVGTDDEMIQSYQVGNSQFDEIGKYESRAEPETESDVPPEPLAAERQDWVNSYQTGATSDFSSGGSDDSASLQAEPEDSREDEYAGETREISHAGEDFPAQVAEQDPTPQPERASVLELDDMNLLELPPRRSFSAAAPAKSAAVVESIAPIAETISEVPETQPETPETPETSEMPESSETSSSESNVYQFESNDVAETVASTDVEAASSWHLSPEIIDAIAAKVVEKLSDQVIREIAWEVVPQMTDLIVKRMAEEKLKD